MKGEKGLQSGLIMICLVVSTTLTSQTRLFTPEVRLGYGAQLIQNNGWGSSAILGLSLVPTDKNGLTGSVQYCRTKLFESESNYGDPDLILQGSFLLGYEGRVIKWNWMKNFLLRAEAGIGTTEQIDYYYHPRHGKQNTREMTFGFPVRVSWMWKLNWRFKIGMQVLADINGLLKTGGMQIMVSYEIFGE